MVISLLTNRENVYKTRIFALCLHTEFPFGFISGSIRASFRNLGAALGAVSWHKPEENLHGAFQRGDKPGQSVMKLISRLAPVFKTSSSPKMSKGGTGWRQSVLSCSCLCCYRPTRTHTLKCEAHSSHIGIQPCAWSVPQLLTEPQPPLAG